MMPLARQARDKGRGCFCEKKYAAILFSMCPREMRCMKQQNPDRLKSALNEKNGNRLAVSVCA